MKAGVVEYNDLGECFMPESVEQDLLDGKDIELILSGHRIILRADESGVITGYILEG